MKRIFPSGCLLTFLCFSHVWLHGRFKDGVDNLGDCFSIKRTGSPFSWKDWAYLRNHPHLSFLYGGILALQIKFPALEQLSLFCSGGLSFRGWGMCVTGFPPLRSWWTLQVGESGGDDLWWDGRDTEGGCSLMLQLGILSSFWIWGLMDASSVLLCFLSSVFWFNVFGFSGDTIFDINSSSRSQSRAGYLSDSDSLFHLHSHPEEVHTLLKVVLQGGFTFVCKLKVVWNQSGHLTGL